MVHQLHTNLSYLLKVLSFLAMKATTSNETQLNKASLLSRAMLCLQVQCSSQSCLLSRAMLCLKNHRQVHSNRTQSPVPAAMPWFLSTEELNNNLPKVDQTNQNQQTTKRPNQPAPRDSKPREGQEWIVPILTEATNHREA